MSQLPPLLIGHPQQFWQPLRQPSPKPPPNLDAKCYFCGFACDGHQEIHHLDHDHSNQHADNLVTICPLCHAVVHIGLTAALGRGKLVWLPNIPQQVVNQMALWLEVSSLFQNHPLVAEVRAKIDRQAQQAAELVGTRSLRLLAQRLQPNAMAAADYKVVEQYLAPNLRLWPLFDHYPTATLRAWRLTLDATAVDQDQAATMIRTEIQRSSHAQ